MDVFTPTDLVVYRKEGGLCAGGFKLKGAILNSGNKCKALEQFGIPAGLAYMQREKTAKYDCPSKSDILPDEVLHELLDLASIKPEKKKKGKKKQTKTKKYSKGGKQTKRRKP